MQIAREAHALIAAAIVAIAVAYLLTSGLPDELNLLIPTMLASPFIYCSSAS